MFRGMNLAPKVLRRTVSLPGYTTFLPRSNPRKMSLTTGPGWSICLACSLGFMLVKKCVATGPGQATVRSDHPGSEGVRQRNQSAYIYIHLFYLFGK